MAKDIKFNIKLNVDGKDTVVQVSFFRGEAKTTHRATLSGAVRLQNNHSL